MIQCLTNPYSNSSVSDQRAVGLYDFQTERYEVLPIRAGEEIRVLQCLDRGWLLGTNSSGAIGKFPAAVVQFGATKSESKHASSVDSGDANRPLSLHEPTLPLTSPDSSQADNACSLDAVPTVSTQIPNPGLIHDPNFRTSMVSLTPSSALLTSFLAGSNEDAQNHQESRRHSSSSKRSSEQSSSSSSKAFDERGTADRFFRYSLNESHYDCLKYDEGVELHADARDSGTAEKLFDAEFPSYEELYTTLVAWSEEEASTHREPFLPRSRHQEEELRQRKQDLAESAPIPVMLEASAVSELQGCSTLSTAPCAQCKVASLGNAYCNRCEVTFCSRCWTLQFRHRESSIEAIPHERTSLALAGKLQRVLQGPSNMAAAEELFRDDAETAWFGNGMPKSLRLH